jgi:hypothetical protein
MLSMSADTVSSSEASRWLDRLERGLRDNEGEALRTWLALAGNRSCLLSQARFGRSSAVVAVLTRLFPDSPELKTLRKRRHALSVVAVCACAATIVVAACYACTAGQASARCPAGVPNAPLSLTDRGGPDRRRRVQHARCAAGTACAGKPNNSQRIDRSCER